jgi:ABC-type multidrug transport system fused ATPase/permease subunit
VIALISRYGRPHRWWLGQGVAATLAWVVLRLAMPWPLRGVVEAAFHDHGHGHKVFWSTGHHSLLWFCVAYLFIAVGLGVSDMLLRVGIGRFVAHTVHDMRGTALRGAVRKDARAGAAISSPDWWGIPRVSSRI